MINEIAVREKDLVMKLEEAKNELREVRYQIFDIHPLEIDLELRRKRDYLIKKINRIEHLIESL